MRGFDAPTELGSGGAKDLERLRLENAQLRCLVIDLSKLVLVNVASSKERTVPGPVSPAHLFPEISIGGSAEEGSATPSSTPRWSK